MGNSLRTGHPFSRHRSVRLAPRLTRRLVVTLLLLSLTGIARAQALTAQEKALHVLNRLGYGPAPGDMENVTRMGPQRYIEQQLHPERIALPPQLLAKLDSLPTTRMNATQLYVQYGPPSFPPKDATQEEKTAAQQRAGKEITPQAHLARLWQASESPRQLQEVMTEFWFNHFNVFEGKEWVRYWEADYEKNALRPNALGNFRQLLGAVAHHPAMLYYLDNWLSSGVNTPEAKGRFKGLNENYARELMELHTLGVNGGYTQDDVIALARLLSGWTIDEKGMREGLSPFVFNPRRHDGAPKVFLGQRISGGGEQDAERALDILAASPATARFISTKLVRYFVSDQPDPHLVEQLSRRFLDTHGDIRAVLQSLFDSPSFWDRNNYQSQFKTPYQYVLSSLRASGLPILNQKPVEGILNQLGMPLYGWLTPEGYQFSEAAWLSPDALLRRINFASGLGNGKSPIARPDGAPANNFPAAIDPRQLMLTLAPTLSADRMEKILAAPTNLQTALILGGPDFMKR
ncbi:DUF1800 domain-containing protein [Herbaspirillum sp. RTI4]|uniref:DUF1800 domain-containing protein n=1 Tax=Herbaspirillum sp. RTI4 TaxID=3048640 RepID=UPI002AB35B2D|nr:DUF1800 domain-containing protein [Herbaspirillum sp. RTI4]MDY7579664.1 DUF1800 domain-containing protein [Herbaspirillum sp. RTI4]MEA9981879.1 DUF1800 domain-containing protein [Herbaspirillum sp. RTI4]